MQKLIELPRQQLLPISGTNSRRWRQRVRYKHLMYEGAPTPAVDPAKKAVYNHMYRGDYSDSEEEEEACKSHSLFRKYANHRPMAGLRVSETGIDQRIQLKS